jgi:hypothetical protein
MTAAGPTDRTATRFRVVIGTATMLMLALSWPLWVGAGDFPRIPFVEGLRDWPGGLSWGAFGLVLGTMALATAGIATRPAFGGVILTLLVLILHDQHRSQPWVYQFLMAALAWATVPASRALGLTRLFIVALYFHSGLSKLDVSFVRELGRVFLESAARPFGLEPTGWPEWVRTAAILAMPAWEIVVAVGLCIRKTRRLALVGAIALHAALLGVLGPWGLGHSTIVLVWNAALIVEDLILFGPELVATAPEPPRRLEPWTRAAFLLAAVLPFGERAGLFDSWPSFALYASHVERTEVLFHIDDLAEVPESIRRHVRPGGERGGQRLDLTAWSRAERGVPVYPQGRANNGVAEALAVQYRGAFGVQVVQWGRADWLSGARSRDEALGPEAISRLGRRYRLNAHPAWPAAGPGLRKGTLR